MNKNSISKLKTAEVYFRKGDLKNGDKILHKISQEDLSEAYLYFGECLAYGKGMKQNPKKGLIYLRRAADYGEPRAQYRLGLFFLDGVLVKRDAKKGWELLLKSAKSGFSEAQYHAATFYDYGYGVEEDPKAAIHWYKKAGNQGHAYALTDLGYFYSSHPDFKDRKEAERWFRKGLTALERDAKRGVRYLEKLGSIEFLLANFYFEGMKDVGLKRDFKKAAYWAKALFKNSDRMEKAFGHQLMGYLHEKGLGVKKDLYLAESHLKNASVLGSVEAKSRYEKFLQRKNKGVKNE